MTTPIFDFMAGKPNFNGEVITLGKNDILIIEGIHGLNPEILKDIPKKNKYRIYISPLTCLNLDSHNRISTTDNRLLRRIIRDNKHRGNSVEATLENGQMLEKGKKRIFFHIKTRQILYLILHLFMSLGC